MAEPSPADLPPHLSASPPPPDASDGGSGWQPDEPLGPDESDPASSTASTPSRPKVVKAVDRVALEKTAVTMVTGAGEIAHVRLAQDGIDQHLQVWQVSDHEAQQIGAPLASLVARHSNGVAGLANPDLADGIAALMGVAAYVGRQLKLRKIARTMRGNAQLEGDEPQTVPADL